MTTNFDQIIPRRGTNSYKWDMMTSDDVLPLWVADMDFQTAPAIVQALQDRVDHGIFGYTRVPEAYYSAVCNWFARRHRWTIKPEWIIYTTGVVPAVSAILKALTEPGDKVIVQTPAYNCFFSSIRNDGCQLLANPLREVDGRYEIDFEDLERKAADPQAKVLILCNPHNPVGRVWTRSELERIGDICWHHGVKVLSDEIHCELTYPGHDYTPFGSLGEVYRQMSITCVSPSKAFNIAGLQIANIVAADEEVRRKIDRAINVNEVCDVNPFGPIATIAAYNESEAWLDELRPYLWRNYETLCRFFKVYFPAYKVTPLEGTYLAWIDCRAVTADTDALTSRLLKEARVAVNAGSLYGPEGQGFIRINLACPRTRLFDALERIQSVM